MAFEIEDYHDLVRLLHDHPEWRTELRRLLLTDELLELPQIVRELAEAQRRTEERVEALAEAQRRTEDRVEELAEAQRRTEERVEELAEAQRRTEERVEELAEAQRRTEERLGRVEEQIAALAEAQRQMADAQRQMAEEVKKLAADQRRISDNVADMKGTILEWKYKNKAAGYFGAVLRRVRVVEPHTIEDQLEASLTEDEIREVLRLDLIVRGWLSRQSDAEVYLAVEISSVIDSHDVQRARERTYLLRKAGYRTIPMVVGEHLTPGAEFETKEHSVPVMQDGMVTYWDEAVQRWAAQ